MGCGSSKVSSTVEINYKHAPATQRSHTSEGQHLNDVISNATLNVNSNDGTVENLENYSSSSRLSAGNEGFKQRKRKLIPSVDIFKEADERALKAPLSLKSSSNELVDYLIEPFENSDLLKLRAIWMWITHNIVYDVDSFFNPDDRGSSQIDARSTLASGKAVCSGYASVCKCFSEHAGIKMESVTGWAKGYSYITGMSLSDREANHAWNVVYLAGSWWLLDSTWAAGHVDENKNFQQQYNEHYFLTDPKEFIFDHFPEDSSWQLLETRSTLSEYEQMAKFTKDFFYLKMKPVTHTNGKIDCSDGKIRMKFRIEKEFPIKCVGKLIKEDENEGTDKHIHTYTTDKVLHVLVNLPAEGKYHLKLFARLANREDEGELPMICSYSINCTRKVADGSAIFPKQYKKWSPGFYLHSPTEGQLYVGETYTFKINLPGIIEMAVCLGGKKSSWIRIPNTTGAVWEGDVTMDTGTERVSVVAKFDKQTNTTFSSVLEYQVLEKL